jgi:hypothetical protein
MHQMQVLSLLCGWDFIHLQGSVISYVLGHVIIIRIGGHGKLVASGPTPLPSEVAGRSHLAAVVWKGEGSVVLETGALH